MTLLLTGDTCLLRQHEEDLGDLKSDFGNVRSSLYSLDIEDSSDISVLLASVCDRNLFISSSLSREVQQDGAQQVWRKL